MRSEGIRPEEVLRIVSKQKWVHNGRELTKGEIDSLKADASLIANSKLWQLIVNEGKYHAQKRAIIDAQNYEELTRVQEFHKVVVLFEQFIHKVINT